ncbi:MAG: hypothetical protein RL885_31365 [Planctomycetota bacterium]
MSFPADDYPPHGYLRNPAHAWVTHPSGVLRSRPPLGFEWRAPKAQRPTWIGGLRVLLGHEGHWLTEPDRLGGTLSAPIHSCERFVYSLSLDDIQWEVEYVPVSKDCLAVCLTARNDGSSDRSIDLALAAHLELDFQRSRRWSYRLSAGRDARSLWLRPFAEGRGIRLTLSERAASTFARSVDTLPLSKEQGAPEDVPVDTATLVGAFVLEWSLAAGEWRMIEATLERSHWVSDAPRPFDRKAVDTARGRAIVRDELFWAEAPRLEGDWPAHWRRGWVIDFETLRLSRRDPAGIFRTSWDGMQIQVPRFVLAETMLDMATYSLADPSAAQALVSGSLRDAAALGPQLPCVREDGSPNMVARDGTICGTSPAWCWPFACLDLMRARGESDEWIDELRPVLSDYLEYWLRRRRDADGLPFYVCSWESGQDSSERFACHQPTGGECTRHVHPVDLHVGMIQAASFLSRFSNGDRWRDIAEELRASLTRLWTRHGFYDHVRGSDRHDPIEDVTHLSPALLGDVSAAQQEVLQEQLRMRIAERSPGLEWASFFFQLCECGHRLEMPFEIAEVVAYNADRIWSAWDRRDWSGSEPLPGIALEHWALDAPRGGEGYGWGATMPLHLVRGVIGFRDEGDTVRFQPTLPESLWIPGREYTVTSLPHRGGRFDVRISVASEDELEVHWSARDTLAEKRLASLTAPESARRDEKALHWRQPNGVLTELRDGQE